MAYPNPASTQLNLNYVSSTSGKGRFSVLDVMGKEHWVRDTQLVEGENRMELDLQNLSSGMYFVRVETQTGAQMVKIQVMK